MLFSRSLLVCIISFLDSTYKECHMIFLHLWLTSFSITISRSIHVAANDINSFLMVKQYSILYMYHILLTHSSADGHLGSFHVLAIVNSTAVNIVVHVSFWIFFFFLDLSSGEGLKVIWQLSNFFLRNLHVFLQSCCNNFHSYQKYRRAPFSLHPL